MFYFLRTNAALAKLGVSPNVFNKNTKSAWLRMGKRSGITPQELAFWMTAQSPLIHRMPTRLDVVRQWIADGKIDTSKQEIREALGVFAMWDETK